MSPRHRLEALLLGLALWFFGRLSLDRASALGGWIGRRLGPRLGLSDRARGNLRQAFPELDEGRIEAIVGGMWDNLGRVAAEFPHLAKFRCYQADPDGVRRIEVVGAENIDLAGQSESGAIFFSAHLGNWELTPLSAVQRPLALVTVYRQANNPHADALIQAVRQRVGGDHLPKGAAGARGLVAALRHGRSVALVVDQKQNDGIAVDFFGRPAMTAPAAAELALRYGCLLIPARVERLGGARFRITIEPPLELAQSGQREDDVAETMARVNARLEAWIRQRPEQWFWLHRRWPDCT
ncbi:MAG: lauroyl acyltransferase [Alphaproteobacteria bacterium]|nr:lauroyl acyltransferase [Alphaproteobacteria bacterium]MDP6623216.1 lauroyl acyltransferase [Alphaproteobacteria bacterium]